jgi:hypothetical protein
MKKKIVVEEERERGSEEGKTRMKGGCNLRICGNNGLSKT